MNRDYVIISLWKSIATKIYTSPLYYTRYLVFKDTANWKDQQIVQNSFLKSTEPTTGKAARSKALLQHLSCNKTKHETLLCYSLLSTLWNTGINRVIIAEPQLFPRCW